MNYIYNNGIHMDIYLYQQDNIKDPFPSPFSPCHIRFTTDIHQH